MKKNRKTAKEFQCRSVLWGSFLLTLGKYAYGKKIPEFIQNAPIDFVKAFIDGYMKADGHRDKFERGGPRTVSPHLAFGCQRLFLKLGFIYGITLDPRSSTKEHKIKNKGVKKQRPIFGLSGVSRETQMTSFIEKEYAWFLPYKKEEEVSLYTLELANTAFIIENIIISSSS
jgi:intein/homing endonuclease